jgi:hypothetical protein
MATMKRLISLAGVSVAVLVAGMLIAVALRYAPSSSARRAWKDKAIAELSSRVNDSAWVSSELARLRGTGTNSSDAPDSWLSPHLIVMRNGDWIAYASICQKEDRRIRDLFLGHGSDGRWYYSTYHFCKGMIVLRLEDQSEDLATFAQTYCLRPFDGRSDECLRKTWPPDAR